MLFTGKLMMLLLLYIREDAVVVRQPIYGLLFGNVLLFALAYLMAAAHFGLVDAGSDRRLHLPQRNGRVDGLGNGNPVLRLHHHDPVVRAIAELVPRPDISDLHMLTGAGADVLVGGWIAKMAAVALYTCLAGIYLLYFERPIRRRTDMPRIWDIFDTLTYRERYEDLLARTGCDALTGALDRHSLEAHGRRAVDHAAAAGRSLALLLIDIDHFKAYNDRFGHAAGDKMLKRIVPDIMAAARMSDLTYRFGGEEFVVIADGINADDALTLGERMRRRIADSHAGDASGVTVSIGIASCARDATDYDTLFEIADKRLYEAKAAGRNRVIGAGKSVRRVQNG